MTPEEHLSKILREQGEEFAVTVSIAAQGISLARLIGELPNATSPEVGKAYQCALDHVAIVFGTLVEICSLDENEIKQAVQDYLETINRYVDAIDESMAKTVRH